jgi:hypothetical protein
MNTQEIIEACRVATNNFEKFDYTTLIHYEGNENPNKQSKSVMFNGNIFTVTRQRNNIEIYDETNKKFVSDFKIQSSIDYNKEPSMLYYDSSKRITDFDSTKESYTGDNIPNQEFYETPANKAQRLGVPLIPKTPQNTLTTTESRIIAICGECGLEIRENASYSCTNANCPAIKPYIIS